METGDAGRPDCLAILNGEAYNSGYDLNSDATVDTADVVYALHHPQLVPQAQTVSAENTLGFLAWVKDQSGEEHNSYDERGRVQWVVKGIRSQLPSSEGPGAFRGRFLGRHDLEHKE